VRHSPIRLSRLALSYRGSRVGSLTEDSSTLRVLHSRTVRYGAAALAVEIALLAKLLFDPWVQQGGTPFVLFFTAVISAVFGGLGSGLLATFVATLASDYFFLSPGRLLIQDGEYNLRLGIFLLEGLGMSSLSFMLTSARWRAKSDSLSEWGFVPSERWSIL
jgi:K+-sensing histidine kinase KdpD